MNARLSKQAGLLLAILLLAAVLRFWALPFGLPNLTRPDEQNVAGAVINGIMIPFFQGTPSLNPDFFYYPSLYLYMVAGLYTVFYLLGRMVGEFPDAIHFVQAYLSDWSRFLLIQRVLSASLGVLTCWAMARWVDAVLGSRSWGLAGALLLAVCYLHVRESHFGVTDAALTLGVVLALWQTTVGYRTRSYRSLCHAAWAVGLSAAVKYPGMLVGFAPLAAYYQLKAAEQAGVRLRDLWVRTPWLLDVLRLLGIMGGAFLLASPFVLLDFGQFYSHWSLQSASFSKLFSDLPGVDRGWIYHARFTLWYGVGPALLLLAVWGMGCAWFRPDRLHRVLLLVLAVLYLWAGATSMVFVRYVLPVVPLVILYALVGLQGLARWGERLGRPREARVLVASALLVMVGANLWRSIQLDVLLSQADTRSQARSWLLAHLEPGQGVGIGKPLSHVDLPTRFPKYFLVRPERSGARLGGPDQYLPLQDVQPRVNVRADSQRHEFDLTTYTDPVLLRTEGIRYVVLARTPLSLYRAPEDEIQAVEASPDFRLAVVFSPWADGTTAPPETAYNHVDAFYVPFVPQPAVQIRPGPELRIYEVLPAS